MIEKPTSHVKLAICIFRSKSRVSGTLSFGGQLTISYNYNKLSITEPKDLGYF